MIVIPRNLLTPQRYRIFPSSTCLFFITQVFLYIQFLVFTQTFSRDLYYSLLLFYETFSFFTSYVFLSTFNLYYLCIYKKVSCPPLILYLQKIFCFVILFSFYFLSYPVYLLIESVTSPLDQFPFLKVSTSFIQKLNFVETIRLNQQRVVEVTMVG